jgi:hypothetical protein
MAFGINTDGIRTLRDYEAAAKWEALVIPVRGTNPPVKPLGPRRKKHMSIRREGDDIIVRLYHTDIITYKPTGEIVLDHGNYHTQSTATLLYAVLPYGIRTHLFKGRIWMWGDYVEEGENNNSVTRTGHYRLPRRAVITFDPVTHNYRIHNPEPVYTHRVDRKNKNLVMKEYAGFLAYVKAITALRAEDGEVMLGAGETARWLHPRDLDTKMRSDDPADHYDAFLSVPNWQRFYDYRTSAAQTCASTSAIKRAIDKHVTKQNADRILTKTQAPWGVQVDDKYKFYV